MRRAAVFSGIGLNMKQLYSRHYTGALQTCNPVMDKKQIPVEELKLGMYVIELDRPWLTMPFVFQGFSITSTHQIDGSGYPQGLHGRQVSVDGAIAVLVDSYSALTSLRP